MTFFSARRSCSIAGGLRLAVIVTLLSSSSALAQTPAGSAPPTDKPADKLADRPADQAASQNASQAASQADPQAPGLRVQLPTVTVTAQKEPADAQKVPVSVTAVPSTTLESAAIRSVSEAGIYAPNTYYSEFTARKLSNARFRGIGSSPANPGVTTYIDGVPQLSTNSSSIELMDIEQIELVRGPQSALFGRNTLGGLVSIASRRPSMREWTGSLSVPLGNIGARDVRGSVSGPIVGDTLAIGVAAGYARRDGYTVNDLTGHDLDNRSASFGKAQLLWTPNRTWETRVIVSGERARDGDYGLNDLASLRSNPFHAARDFEGHTDRDITSATILNRKTTDRLTLSTTTGIVRWKTQDVTDLDYTPAPLIVRDNTEKDLQFTQEVRLASSENAPIALSDNASLRWQSGVFFFTQNYDQDAVNNFAPFLLSPQITFPVAQHSPESSLDDAGIGFYGQGTVTFNQKLDLSAGARIDHESKEATLNTFFVPTISAPSLVAADDSFTDVSPQLSVAYRVRPDKTVYATVARGFKAGGFNPASPAGSEAYGEEHTWNVEGGVKTTWANGRVSANAAVFSIAWDDLQLNVPNPAVPAQFYVANVGKASSRGIELELNARPHPSVDVFGAFGYTRARFGDGSISSGLDVSDNKLPSTPDYTFTLGTQYTRAVRESMVYGRAEAVFYGAFQYDDANTQGQEAYSLANLIGGVRGKYLFAEVWLRNAFDTRYIPIAFAYGSFAPSGFVGEMGAPRRFGVTAGVTF
jgi:iron complex outermembrane receptor protein